MDLVVVVVLGAVAFLGGILVVLLVVVGLLRSSRLDDTVDRLRPSQRSKKPRNPAGD